jgi:hypothetical protein
VKILSDSTSPFFNSSFIEESMTIGKSESLEGIIIDDLVCLSAVITIK